MGFFSKNSEPFKTSVKKNTKEQTAKVVSFLNQKGGVGKTTMAFNTAHALTKKGMKVLCLDMDPQANLSLLFNQDLSLSEHNNEYDLHHLLINSVRELSALHTPALVGDILVKINEGLHLLPSSQALSGFELSVAGISSPRQLILKKFLMKNALLDQYDVIIIDGPPTLGLLVVNIICSSNGLILPFRPDDFSRKGLKHFYEMIGHVEDMGLTEAPQIIGHIPNLVDTRRAQESQDLADITAELVSEFGEGRVFDAFSNRAHLVKSQSQRKSVYDFKSREFRPLQEQFDVIAGRIEQWSDSYEYKS